jgi:hypothetical protein
VSGKHWFVVSNIIYYVIDINRPLEKSNRRISPQQDVSNDAKRIIIDNNASEVLLRMLKDQENAEQRSRSASCLFRLAQDGKFMHLYALLLLPCLFF